MSVVKQPSPGLSRTGSNDQIIQNNLVRLTDADRVREEPKEIAFRPGPRDTSSTFVFETNLRGDLGKAPAPSDAIEEVPPREDEWSGLEIDQTLGQLMTQTRKHSGLSREQVADRTRIPPYYVKMIESDSYDAIPDQLYLLPFFRRYADFLGLDAKKVVSRFICDFEKAENEVVATPAPTAYGKALQKWRQVAAATVIGAILLPCIAWGIGTMRTAYRHSAGNSPAVASSLDKRPSTAIASTGARPVTTLTPDPAAVSPATVPTALTETNSGSQVVPPAHAQTRPQRSRHAHRLTRHSRRLRQRAGHLT
jgi:transcriptional regulator with XRE-family HTH domain